MGLRDRDRRTLVYNTAPQVLKVERKIQQNVLKGERSLNKRTITVTLLLILFFFAGMTQVQIASAPIPSGWAVVLTATLGAYHDESTFGVESDATECFDPVYDQLKGPIPPCCMPYSYFWHPDCPPGPPDERRLAISIIPPSECVVTWIYEVESVGIDGDMCVSWSALDIADIPSECSVFFDGVNMRETTEHCFAAVADTTYTFTIEVSTQYHLTIGVVGIGTTDPLPGTYPFDCCTDVTVNAIETDPCWTFDYWELDGVFVSTDLSFTIHIDGLHTLTAVFKKGCNFVLQLSAGWNMVSFPCLPEDRNFSSVFSGCGFYQVLTWDGSGYVDVSTENVEAGWGYWVLVLEDCAVSITNGVPVESYERDLPPG